MPLYETVFIARQDVSGAQVETMTADYTTIITGLGGSVPKAEQWGLRNLTYRIAKNRKGHYVLMNIDAPAAAIAEMERQMRINEDVLRYMTIKVDAHETEPSAILRAKSSEGRVGGPRGDRPERGERMDRGDRPDRGERPARADRAPAE